MSVDYNKEQLKDVILTISFVQEGDEGHDYAATKVFRFDLLGRDEDFITYLMDYQPGGDHTGIIDGSVLVGQELD